MTQTIRLRQRGTSLEFVLQGATQIGRFPPKEKGRWAVPERQKPDVFGQLEAYIQVLDRIASRNHCGIMPPTEEGESFSVVDLNSANGTYVNNVRINQRKESNPKPMPLQQGDILTAGNTSFIVDRLEQSLDYALLVAHGEDHAGAAENDLAAVERELARRGYKTRILREQDATKQAVKDAIRELLYVTVPESHVFLYFTGHGGPNGLMLKGQVLNPGELYKPLQSLRGKKAVVIDACNAGLFVDEDNREKIPENVLVLASSGKNEEAREKLLPNGQYRARFSNALAEYLRNVPETFDLNEFHNALISDGTHSVVLQKPVRHGGNYTVAQVVSVLTSAAPRDEAQ